MPKYSISFKESKLNDFLENIQYAHEAIEKLGEYQNRISDEKNLIIAECNLLNLCHNTYNKKIEDVDIVTKNNKLKYDARNISLSLIIANPRFSRQFATTMAMSFLTNYDEHLEDNPEMVRIISGGRNFGSFMQFFAIEYGEGFILKGITENIILSTEVTTKMKLLKQEDNIIEKVNSPEKVAPTLEEQKVVQEIDIASTPIIDLNNEVYKDKLKSDYEVIKNLFGDLDVNSIEYKTVLLEIISRLAKAEVLFKLQEGLEIKRNYLNASRFMYDLLSYKSENYPYLDRRYFSELSKDSFNNLKLEDVKKHIESRRIVKEMMNKQGVKEPEDYIKLFESIFVSVMKGNTTLPSCINLTEKSSNIIGKVLEEIGACFNQLGKPISNYLKDATRITNNAYNYIDGTLFAAEMTFKFKYNDLNKTDVYTMDEVSQNIYQSGNKESKEYNTIVQLMKGIEANKNDDCLLDALATYAKMVYVHNRKSGLFNLLHQKQNKSELTAIEFMENELKNHYHFTQSELEKAVQDKKYDSMDRIQEVSYKLTDFNDYCRRKDQEQIRINKRNEIISSYQK